MTASSTISSPRRMTAPFMPPPPVSAGSRARCAGPARCRKAWPASTSFTTAPTATTSKHALGQQPGHQQQVLAPRDTAPGRPGQSARSPAAGAAPARCPPAAAPAPAQHLAQEAQRHERPAAAPTRPSPARARAQPTRNTSTRIRGPLHPRRARAPPAPPCARPPAPAWRRTPRPPAARTRAGTPPRPPPAPPRPASPWSAPPGPSAQYVRKASSAPHSTPSSSARHTSPRPSPRLAAAPSTSASASTPSPTASSSIVSSATRQPARALQPPGCGTPAPRSGPEDRLAAAPSSAAAAHRRLEGSRVVSSDGTPPGAPPRRGRRPRSAPAAAKNTGRGSSRSSRGSRLSPRMTPAVPRPERHHGPQPGVRPQASTPASRRPEQHAEDQEDEAAGGQLRQRRASARDPAASGSRRAVTAPRWRGRRAAPAGRRAYTARRPSSRPRSVGAAITGRATSRPMGGSSASISSWTR